MRHDTAEALSERLAWLLDNIDRLDSPTVGAGDLIEKWKEEATAIVDVLVGEDPLVRVSIRHLRALFHHSEMVLRDEHGDALLRLGGNEHWVFADVAIGDDYGALDFWRKHAIWRNTGALYRMEHGGAAVVDDPFFVPPGSSYDGPLEDLDERARHHRR